MADLSYQEKLAGLSGASDADLTSLEQEIIAAFEDAEGNDDLAAMSTAADALDQVREAKASAAGQTTQTTESISGGPDTTASEAVAASAADDDADVGEEPEGADEPDEGADEPEGETLPDGVKVVEVGDPVPSAAATNADAADGDGVTAAGLPPALKDHEFKKKGKTPAEGSAAEEADEDPKKEEDEDAVTAASSSPEETVVAVEQTDIPEDRQPLVATSLTTVVAGADIPQRAAGSEFGSFMEVNESFVNRLQTLRNSRGGDGDQVIVASVQSTVDPDRELVAGDDVGNAEKIDRITREMQALAPDAIVASGGYCAPLETRYDIFGFGVSDRPVRDSLAGFQATRGGIRYVAPPVLSSFSAAVGLWTAANDANPTSPTTKPVMTATCQQEVTVTTDAVTLQIQFGNLMTRAFPELVARNNELGLIYHARFAEQNLLTKISALSTAVSSSWVLGTARDVLNSLGRLAAGYRHRNRLNVDTPLRAIMPSWLRDAMREDLTRGHPGTDVEEGIQWADSIINAAVAARNINVTWHIDDANFTGAQNAGAINDFPTTVRYWLFAEGTFLFLDGGTLDLGIVRDSTLVGTNDYRMFVETFEGVAKVGIESIQATVTTHITGANVGTVAPS